MFRSMEIISLDSGTNQNFKVLFVDVSQVFHDCHNNRTKGFDFDNKEAFAE